MICPTAIYVEAVRIKSQHHHTFKPSTKFSIKLKYFRCIPDCMYPKICRNFQRKLPVDVTRCLQIVPSERVQISDAIFLDLQILSSLHIFPNHSNTIHLGHAKVFKGDTISIHLHRASLTFSSYQDVSNAPTTEEATQTTLIISWQ